MATILGTVQLPSGAAVEIAGNHPAAESWPLLDGPELDALTEDIRVNGQRVRVILTPDRLVLDGRNRIRACQRAGVVPLGTVETVADPAALVESLNEHRRHMSPTARAARHLALREQGKSVREIAGITGASVGTVHNDLQVFNSEHVPDQITGTDGKTYPASRPAPDGHRGLDALWGSPESQFPRADIPGGASAPPDDFSTTEVAAGEKGVGSGDTPLVAAEPSPAGRSRSSAPAVDLDQDPEEAAAVRWTGNVARAIGDLYGDLGDDPGAAVARSWRSDAHPWRALPGLPGDLYKPAGLRRLAARITVLADYLTTTGTNL